MMMILFFIQKLLDFFGSRLTKFSVLHQKMMNLLKLKNNLKSHVTCSLQFLYNGFTFKVFHQNVQSSEHNFVNFHCWDWSWDRRCSKKI